MKTNELKPCPFCGETKYLKQEGDTVICDFCFDGDWNSRPVEDGLRAEIDRLKTALTEIRDLARTGLAPDAYNFDTEEKWLRHKVNRIAGMASRELDKERE